MKNIILSLILIVFCSCQKENNNCFNSAEKSIESTLENFPMINNKLQKIREVNLDSLSIKLYRNPHNNVYDEIIVFEKKKKFYAIPFFSNMYFDYWNFKNETQKQLYPKTNSSFEKQLNLLIEKLELTPPEFDLLFQELMSSVLHTEINLYLKPKLFENYVYLTWRVDKYKTEESEECIKRTTALFDKILNDSKKTFQDNRYYLDSENGRVYEFINESRKRNEFKFRIEVYRIECFGSRLNM